MLIIIDYDETFTEDKPLWSKFIRDAQESNHTIICCTMRLGHETMDANVINDMSELNVPVVFAANRSDKWEAVEKAGYDPQDAVWIDDRPMYIYMNRNFKEFD